MKIITVQSLNNDSIKIFISESSNTKHPKGVIHIYHGMAEHFGRYKETTNFFNSIGYHVVGIDHRGHGHWIEGGARPGFFADKDGWNVVLNDMETAFTEIKSAYQDLDHFILAHSMGTWLTLSFLQRGVTPAKVILSASSKLSIPALKIQKFLLKVFMIFQKPESTSYISDKLTVAKFNSFFKPNRTTHDWLSRDHKSVDDYVKSNLCGFIPTHKMYEDLANGIIKMFSNKQMLKISKDIPLLLIAGDKDPVGDNGKGVNALDEFLNGYLSSIKTVILADYRHEILNEVGKEQTLKEISSFLQS